MESLIKGHGREKKLGTVNLIDTNFTTLVKYFQRDSMMKISLSLRDISVDEIVNLLQYHIVTGN